jgi:putative pantetheine hydrolase
MRHHGPNNAITDVEGIRVGHYQSTDEGYQTGTTVVWAPGGAVGSAYVGGGWPGSINTDVLQPGKNEQKIDVAFLTGGSYYGLQVFGGIIEWLEQNKYGLVMGGVPEHVDPLVAGAVVYDLARGGNFKARPNYEFGYKAMQAAKTGSVLQGNVGAGTGTSTNGGLRLKGGIGTASEVIGNVTVGVIVSVNAGGTPVNLQDCSLRGTAINIQNEFAHYRPPTAAGCTALKQTFKITASSQPSQGSAVAEAFQAKSSTQDDYNVHPNTTIGVVATNAILTKAQAHQLARAVNDGFAAVIIPFGTNGDGDAVFAMATGKVAITNKNFKNLLNTAKSIAGRSVAHAMLNAKTFDKLQSYCDALPGACR